jgi:hypothetical protein
MARGWRSGPARSCTGGRRSKPSSPGVRNASVKTIEVPAHSSTCSVDTISHCCNFFCFFVLASFVTVLVGGSCNSVVRLLQSPACRRTCILRSREPKAATTPEVTASLQQRSRENVQHVLAE